MANRNELTVTPETVVRLLGQVEDELFRQRDRLIGEAAAFEAMRLGQCALAATVVGPTVAFLLGIKRFCETADVIEAETRRDTLLTSIEAIETAVSRLPTVADLLASDPDRAVRATEIMIGVVVAARQIDGLSGLLDDGAELLRGIVDDAEEATKSGGIGLVAGVILGIGGMVALRSLLA